jgi:hypothetical protein
LNFFIVSLFLYVFRVPCSMHCWLSSYLLHSAENFIVFLDCFVARFLLWSTILWVVPMTILRFGFIMLCANQFLYILTPTPRNKNKLTLFQNNFLNRKMRRLHSNEILRLLSSLKLSSRPGGPQIKCKRDMNWRKRKRNGKSTRLLSCYIWCLETTYRRRLAGRKILRWKNLCRNSRFSSYQSLFGRSQILLWSLRRAIIYWIFAVFLSNFR